MISFEKWFRERGVGSGEWGGRGGRGSRGAGEQGEQGRQGEKWQMTNDK
jgi:hypothetical protein